MTLTRSDIDGLMVGIAGPIKEYVAQEVTKAVNGLVRDAGIWRADRSYRGGDLVTDRGSAFVAQRATSEAERPGTGDGWRLIQKTETSHVRRIVREEMQREPTVRWS